MSVTSLLAIIAFIMVIAYMIGRAPLWISVFLIALIELIRDF